MIDIIIMIMSFTRCSQYLSIRKIIATVEGKTESEVEKYLLALRVSQFNEQTALFPLRCVLIGLFLR